MPDTVKPLAGFCVLTADCVSQLDEKIDQMPTHFRAEIKAELDQHPAMNREKSAVKLNLPGRSVSLEFKGRAADMITTWLARLAAVVLAVMAWVWIQNRWDELQLLLPATASEVVPSAEVGK